MAASYSERVSSFQDVLKGPKIDVTELTKMCFNGVPDSAGMRSVCWKILLNYLPAARTTWPDVLAKQRQLYKEFLEEMIIQPGSKEYSTKRTDVTMEDHPLNPKPDSQWSQYFKDNEVLLQIDKDTRRLQPDIGFFQTATDYPCKELVDASTTLETLRKRIEHTMLHSVAVAKSRAGITNMVTSKKPMKMEFGHDTLEEGQEAHWEVLERILFIYAKLNPGQGYVQGMNEIIGPLYYAFAADKDLSWREHAEADTFFCFTNLMSKMRDTFIKTLDDSPTGINAKMVKLMQMVKRCDAKIWLQFQKQDLKPQFFAFRWLTLWLTQEFPLPDVTRLWDSLLCDEGKPEFLLCVCCAMILSQKDIILEGDFATNIKMLQHFPAIDMHELLKKAIEVREFCS
ncbi:TBC1 domain family member 13-like [Lytechinus pictus]|uniref:TBC1 domain family member 13-like n=1 Tax=Lytechinus pictus TaxID=7653 RepID=UPI00240D6C30|nr:TBC1 domain family member 13-like [Lytechinus pictus]